MKKGMALPSRISRGCRWTSEEAGLTGVGLGRRSWGRRETVDEGAGKTMRGNVDFSREEAHLRQGLGVRKGKYRIHPRFPLNIP